MAEPQQSAAARPTAAARWTTAKQAMAGKQSVGRQTGWQFARKPRQTRMEPPPKPSMQTLVTNLQCTRFQKAVGGQIDSDTGSSSSYSTSSSSSSSGTESSRPARQRSRSGTTDSSARTSSSTQRSSSSTSGSSDADSGDTGRRRSRRSTKSSARSSADGEDTDNRKSSKSSRSSRSSRSRRSSRFSESSGSPRRGSKSPRTRSKPTAYEDVADNDLEDVPGDRREKGVEYIDMMDDPWPSLRSDTSRDEGWSSLRSNVSNVSKRSQDESRAKRNTTIVDPTDEDVRYFFKDMSPSSTDAEDEQPARDGPPRTLYVRGGGDRTGKYRLLKRGPGEDPMWQKTDSPEHAIRSNADGQWIIGTAYRSDMPHQGRLPHEMVEGWRVYDQSKQDWQPSTQTKVQTDDPTPKALYVHAYEGQDGAAFKRKYGGRYDLCDSKEYQVTPTWRRPDIALFIFSDEDGHWCVGGSEEGDSSVADVFSANPHDLNLPHEIPFGDWVYFADSEPVSPTRLPGMWISTSDQPDPDAVRWLQALSEKEAEEAARKETEPQKEMDEEQEAFLIQASRIFFRCDVDGDEMLSKAELVRLCRGDPDVADFLGFPRALREEGVPQEKILAWFDDLEGDADGKVGWEDFYLWAEARQSLEPDVQQDAGIEGDAREKLEQERKSAIAHRDFDEVVREIFTACDTNSDERISKEELMTLCMRDPDVAEFLRFPDKSQDDDALLDAIDEWYRTLEEEEDDDGEVTFEKFKAWVGRMHGMDQARGPTEPTAPAQRDFDRAAWIAKKRSEAFYQEVVDIYIRCDEDCNDWLDKRELVELCMADREVADFLGFPIDSATPDGIQAWFDDLDADGDQRVTWPEFREWAVRKHAGQLQRKEEQTIVDAAAKRQDELVAMEAQRERERQQREDAVLRRRREQEAALKMREEALAKRERDLEDMEKARQQAWEKKRNLAAKTQQEKEEAARLARGNQVPTTELRRALAPISPQTAQPQDLFMTDEELEQYVLSAPVDLYVMDAGPMSGHYVLTRQRNSTRLPIWKRVGSFDYLFSNPRGQWTIGDEHEEAASFESLTGNWTTKVRHCYRWPHEMPAGCWVYYDDATADWVTSPSMYVSLHENPASSSGPPAWAQILVSEVKSFGHELRRLRAQQEAMLQNEDTEMRAAQHPTQDLANARPLDDHAIILIQARLRGHIARRHCRPMIDARARESGRLRARKKGAARDSRLEAAIVEVQARCRAVIARQAFRRRSEGRRIADIKECGRRQYNQVVKRRQEQERAAAKQNRRQREHEEQAVREVQAIMRGYLQRIKTGDVLATKRKREQQKAELQRERERIRAQLKKKEAEERKRKRAEQLEERRRQEAAVTKIQAMRRGVLSRRGVGPAILAMRTEKQRQLDKKQRNEFARRERLLREQRHKAAVRIQCAWRAHLARTIIKERRFERLNARDRKKEAVRRHKEKLALEAKARRLQELAGERDRQEEELRRRVREQLEEAQRRQLDTAATRLQAVARGRATRKSILMHREQALLAEQRALERQRQRVEAEARASSYLAKEQAKRQRMQRFQRCVRMVMILEKFKQVFWESVAQAKEARRQRKIEERAMRLLQRQNDAAIRIQRRWMQKVTSRRLQAMLIAKVTEKQQLHRQELEQRRRQQELFNSCRREYEIKLSAYEQKREWLEEQMEALRYEEIAHGRAGVDLIKCGYSPRSGTSTPQSAFSTPSARSFREGRFQKVVANAGPPVRQRAAVRVGQQAFDFGAAAPGGVRLAGPLPAGNGSQIGSGASTPRGAAELLSYRSPTPIHHGRSGGAVPRSAVAPASVPPAGIARCPLPQDCVAPVSTPPTCTAPAFPPGGLTPAANSHRSVAPAQVHPGGPPMTQRVEPVAFQKPQRRGVEPAALDMRVDAPGMDEDRWKARLMAAKLRADAVAHIHARWAQHGGNPEYRLGTSGSMRRR